MEENPLVEPQQTGIEELLRTNSDLQSLLDGAQVATVLLDRSLVVRSHTPLAAAALGLHSEDGGTPVADLIERLECDDLRADVQSVLDTHQPLERPVRVRDREERYLMRILPYHANGAAQTDGALVTLVDVSRITAAEEQQRVLTAELNHRVRNMLQVVIGLCNQTLHRSSSLKQFEGAFMGRMQALARVYELLSRHGWRRVPIAELVRTELSPYASEGERWSQDGPRAELTGGAAMSLGLILHELAANAAQCGAMSSGGGRVAVSWSLESSEGADTELVLKWIESGGPVVTPPTHTGLGSELVNRQLRYELSGRASMEFPPEGVRVTLALPAKNVLREEERGASHAA